MSILWRCFGNIELDNKSLLNPKKNIQLETKMTMFNSPLWIGGISSPSASSLIKVPETGELLSSSNGKRRATFLRPDKAADVRIFLLPVDSSPDVRGLLWILLRFWDLLKWSILKLNLFCGMFCFRRVRILRFDSQFKLKLHLLSIQ